MGTEVAFTPEQETSVMRNHASPSTLSLSLIAAAAVASVLVAGCDTSESVVGSHPDLDPETVFSSTGKADGLPTGPDFVLDGPAATLDYFHRGIWRFTCDNRSNLPGDTIILNGFAQSGAVYESVLIDAGSFSEVFDADGSEVVRNGDEVQLQYNLGDGFRISVVAADGEFSLTIGEGADAGLIGANCEGVERDFSDVSVSGIVERPLILLP